MVQRIENQINIYYQETQTGTFIPSLGGGFDCQVLSTTIDDGLCLLPVADCSQCNGAVLEIIDTNGDGICDADEVTCPEDINRDGIVDVNDFLMLASVFGASFGWSSGEYGALVSRLVLSKNFA